MKNFLFNTTKSIQYEIGSSNKLYLLFNNLISHNNSHNSHNNSNNKRKIMMITDKGILTNNLHQKCINNLENNNYEVIIYSNIISDPPENNILEAVEISKENNIQGIIGFGGGSSMDVAKLVAFLSKNETNQKLSDLYGIDKCIGNRLPLIQVPTTAGTGSEVTPISIITTGESEKKGIISQQLLPDWAVLDGELTLKLPPFITAATGIDAMVHAIEAYTTKFKKNPLSDLLAKEALSLLGSNIRTVCTPEGSQNPHARGCMLLGSMYAGMAFANAPVAGVHALAYPLGTHFHVSHGVSNSLMLP